MPPGADGGHQEADAVLAGQQALAVAHDLAETLDDVAVPEDAEADILHGGHVR